ncbi:MAG TPA: carboxypeptidase-like regulatory domain-containing protein, partial [Cyclobacteriaceae bacterium]|nr:carboxypeptidase-like regulatory domain-containing protein [Cyclobacteriaceae bacterium]
MNKLIKKRQLKLFMVGLLFLFLSDKASAQWPDKKASFNLGKIKLETALFKLKDIYGINFSYGNNVIPLNRHVEMRASDKTLKEVLDMILPTVGVSYKFVGNIITLKPIQSKQNIRGKVIDKTSGESLAGVNVVLLDLDTLTGGTTDAEGNFVIPNIKTGHYALKASFIGYEDAIASDVVVNSGKEPFVTIAMNQATVNLQEVVVSPSLLSGQPINNFSLAGGRSFSVEETKRFASNFNDPARMITAYPGVVANNDLTNSMAIRGNSPNGMQWRLEGI